MKSEHNAVKQILVALWRDIIRGHDYIGETSDRSHPLSLKRAIIKMKKLTPFQLFRVLLFSSAYYSFDFGSMISDPEIEENRKTPLSAYCLSLVQS